LLLPGLGVREDEKAIEQLQKYYPHHKVILIPGCLELVKEGGALNCISWNIVSNKRNNRHYEQN
jgi:agmatine/peptidylarginine deiminase